jgi:hypothetical protein
MRRRTAGPAGAVVRDEFPQYDVDIGTAMAVPDDGGGGIHATQIKVVWNFATGYSLSCFVGEVNYGPGFIVPVADRAPGSAHGPRATVTRGFTSPMVSAFDSDVSALLLTLLARPRRFDRVTFLDCRAIDRYTRSGDALPPARSHASRSQTCTGGGWSTPVSGRRKLVLYPVFVSCWASRPAGDGRISARTAR